MTMNKNFMYFIIGDFESKKSHCPLRFFFLFLTSVDAACSASSILCAYHIYEFGQNIIVPCSIAVVHTRPNVSLQWNHAFLTLINWANFLQIDLGVVQNTWPRDSSTIFDSNSPASKKNQTKKCQHRRFK